MNNKVKIKVIKKDDVEAARVKRNVPDEVKIEPAKKMASTVSGWIKEFQKDQHRKTNHIRKFSTI